MAAIYLWYGLGWGVDAFRGTGELDWRIVLLSEYVFQWGGPGHWAINRCGLDAFVLFPNFLRS